MRTTPKLLYFSIALALCFLWLLFCAPGAPTEPLWDDGSILLNAKFKGFEIFANGLWASYPFAEKLFFRPLTVSVFAFVNSSENPLATYQFVGSTIFLSYAFIALCFVWQVFQFLSETAMPEASRRIRLFSAGAASLTASSYLIFSPFALPGAFWAAGLGDMLAATFGAIFALRLAMILRDFNRQRPNAIGLSPSIILCVESFALSFAASLSKDTGLLFLILSLAALFSGFRMLQSFRKCLPPIQYISSAFAGFVAASVLRSLFTESNQSISSLLKLSSFELYGYGRNLWFFAETFKQYLFASIAPGSFSSIYHTPAQLGDPYPAALTCAAFAIACACAYGGYVSKKLWARLLFAHCLAILCLSALQTVGRMNWDNSAIDRYLLITLPFWAAGVTGCLLELFSLKGNLVRIGPVFAALYSVFLLAGSSAASIQDAPAWKHDNLTLWTYIVQQNPNSTYVLANWSAVAMREFPEKYYSSMFAESNAGKAMRQIHLAKLVLPQTKEAADAIDDVQLNLGHNRNVEFTDNEASFAYPYWLYLTGKGNYALEWIGAKHDAGVRLPGMYQAASVIHMTQGNCPQALEFFSFAHKIAKDRMRPDQYDEYFLKRNKMWILPLLKATCRPNDKFPEIEMDRKL